MSLSMGVLALMPSSAAAQDEAATTEVAATETAGDAATDGLYTPLGQDMVKGIPVSAEDDFYGSMNVQPQFSDVGEYANGFHVALIWIMAIISVFVLGLIFWVVVRYNKRANPTPSKTTHNTFIEVVWTLVPVLILIGIALPSISLLAMQYEDPPEDAITVKATGAQWNWQYSLPDYGVEFTSNMLNLKEGPEINPGIRQVGSEAWDGPGQLEVDNRLVLPVGKPLRIQTTAQVVIHSFAVPALWFKLDAVPGRLNERMLTINEPGIYYGQCSELCGVKHGYMPIAIEALPMDKFEDWVRSKGGTVPGDAPAEEAPSDDAADADAAAETEAPTEPAADAAAAE
ncbi:MAG: cytochrome c oxidase subunit II [Marinomonas sp.]